MATIVPSFAKIRGPSGGIDAAVVTWSGLAASGDLGQALQRTDLVDRSVQGGKSFDEVERGVFQKVLAIGRSAVNLFLKEQGDGDLGENVITKEGVTLDRSETVMPRPVRSIFGEHSFEAFVYSRGPKQKIELRPIDARLNLPAGKASYLLQEFSQLFCVEKAFAVGARQFQTVFRQQLSVDGLEDINRAMGEQAEHFLDDLAPLPPTENAPPTSQASPPSWPPTSSPNVPASGVSGSPG